MSLALAALGSTSSCGTLAASSRGDVDLPASIAGPFTELSPAQNPGGTNTLIAGRGGQLADEPCVITVGPLRVAYVTLWRGTPGDAAATRTIGRTVESGPRTLSFVEASDVFTAQNAWEGGSVGAPHVVLEGASSYVLVYEAAGRIGLARSTDGVTFERRAEPILTPLAAMSEGPALSAPSLARAPDGTWWLAYGSAGQIFVASASAPEGPYTRHGAVLTPRTDPTLSGGDGGVLGFEANELDDPALAIETTPTGRTAFYLFYTAVGVVPMTTGMAVPLERIGLAGSYDGLTWSRTARAVFQPRGSAARPGSLDRVDDRTALVWFSGGSGRARRVSAAVGPLVPRVAASVPR